MPWAFDAKFMGFRLLSSVPHSLFVTLLYLRLRRVIPFAVAHPLRDVAQTRRSQNETECRRWRNQRLCATKPAATRLALMSGKYFQLVVLLCLLLGHAYTVAAQSSSVTLNEISQQVQNYIQKTRKWKHWLADPPTPPGSKPSPDVSINFWSSEQCLTVDLRVDGKALGTHPVPCRIKLAIDQSPSEIAARNRLSEFFTSSRESNPTPLAIGDKAYLWNGSHIVFLKGRFTFWLSGSVDLRVGDLLINRDFMEKLARDIATAANANE